MMLMKIWQQWCDVRCVTRRGVVTVSLRDDDGDKPRAAGGPPPPRHLHHPHTPSSRAHRSVINRDLHQSYYCCRNVQVCEGLLSAPGLPKVGVPHPRLPSPCGHQCRDPGHPLCQWQGVFNIHEYVLQVDKHNYDETLNILKSVHYTLDCWTESTMSLSLELDNNSQRDVEWAPYLDKQQPGAGLLVPGLPWVPQWPLDP